MNEKDTKKLSAQVEDGFFRLANELEDVEGRLRLATIAVSRLHRFTSRKERTVASTESRRRLDHVEDFSSDSYDILSRRVGERETAL